MTTGETIKELRKNSGMTQEELGMILGVKKAAIQKYENGEIINLKAATIRKLCETFDVDPWRFVFPEAQKFDMKYNSSRIKDEVSILEIIQNTYNRGVAEIFAKYIELPDNYQERISYYIEDLYELFELKSSR